MILIHWFIDQLSVGLLTVSSQSNGEPDELVLVLALQ